MAAKLTIEDMRAVAASRGGECLSTEYVNTGAKLLWRCRAGHCWSQTGSNVRRGTWCPWCAGRGPLTIKDMHVLAAERGGKCLSTEYINNRTKLQWECQFGHRWLSPGGHISSGSWCPWCAGRGPLTIEDMRALAAERGGECLSTEYVNNRTKLRWRCSEGHCWSQDADHIRRGVWCPACGGSAPRTLEEMHSLAASRGGECLSTEYVNARTKLRWRCSEGHCWSQISDHIRRGVWCPICAVENAEGGVGERLAVEALCEASGLQFKKVRPAWLENAQGRRLELDAYCPERKIAFEYQGSMHYKFNPHFHSSRAAFAKRRRHDSLKRKLCAEHGVLLIQMPEVARPTPENIRAALVRLCEAMAFPIELNPEYAAMVGASRAHMDSETPSD